MHKKISFGFLELISYTNISEGFSEEDLIWFPGNIAESDVRYKMWVK